MTKNRFDTRTWVEISEDLKNERSSPGDKIVLEIKFNGYNKPNFYLRFFTVDPEKDRADNREEITDWIDDTPWYEVIDDTTGKPLEGEMRKGTDSWRDYVEVRFGPLIQSLFKSGGRVFEYKEITE